jgi:hypothetical protein
MYRGVRRRVFALGDYRDVDRAALLGEAIAAGMGRTGSDSVLWTQSSEQGFSNRRPHEVRTGDGRPRERLSTSCRARPEDGDVRYWARTSDPACKAATRALSVDELVDESSASPAPCALSRRTTDGSTNGSTDLSPRPAVRCISLQRGLALVAGGFSCQQSVAAVPQGLLIPRSQVRILPGPFSD